MNEKNRDKPSFIIEYTIELTSGQTGKINSLELEGRTIESQLGRRVIVRGIGKHKKQYDGVLKKVLSSETLIPHSPHKILACVAVDFIVSMLFVVSVVLIIVEFPKLLGLIVTSLIVFYVMLFGFPESYYRFTGKIKRLLGINV